MEFSAPSKMERAFWEFHQNNPHVFVCLRKLALEWHRATRRKLGIAMLFERARWELGLMTVSDDGLKLNNNHRAYYARMLMGDSAELRGIFKLRRQRFQSTIGPDNSSLPPGGHISP